MTHRLIAATVLAAAAALALTGCTVTTSGTPSAAPADGWSQYADDPAFTEDAGVTETPAPAAAPPTTERGALPLAFGETGRITYQVDGSVLAEFAVHGMKVHKGCDNRFIKPPAGMRPISIDITVNTHADPTGTTLQFLMFGQSWEYIAPDGTSFEASPGAGMSCDYNSPDLKPNRKYTETIWLLIPADAPTDGTGHMVWTPSSNVSFEWALTA